MSEVSRVVQTSIKEEVPFEDHIFILYFPMGFSIMRRLYNRVLISYCGYSTPVVKRGST
jgi:hypothetical protein